MASAAKPEKQVGIQDLLSKISSLERAHKRILAQKTLQDLLAILKLLLEELRHRLKKKYTLSQKLFYEHGNKNEHMLAQVLRSKKSKATIHHLALP